MIEIGLTYRSGRVKANRGFRIVDVTETTRHVRALFISDVHLGSRACKAEELLDFLRHHDADELNPME